MSKKRAKRLVPAMTTSTSLAIATIKAFLFINNLQHILYFYYLIQINLLLILVFIKSKSKNNAINF